MSKKIKCYSVRLRKVVNLSEKSFRVEDFDGGSDVLPKSQFFGKDDGAAGNDSYWVAAWLLPDKNLTYSTAREREFDRNQSSEKPRYNVITHIPAEIKVFEQREPIKELLRDGASTTTTECD